MYYRSIHFEEQSAPAALRPWVECVWRMETPIAIADFPVRPDGCIDIVYSRERGLQAVGAMSRQAHYDLGAGTVMSGVRFRPGMARGFLGLRPGALTDRTVSLEPRGFYAEAQSLCSLLAPPPDGPSPVQRAIAHMARLGGRANLDWVADQTGLSARQFRRRCLEESGLTPKRLCRILRFRRSMAAARASRAPDWSRIAAEGGYFDQAHLIRDFREFTGTTPMAVFSKTGFEPLV